MAFPSLWVWGMSRMHCALMASRPRALALDNPLFAFWAFWCVPPMLSSGLVPVPTSFGGSAHRCAHFVTGTDPEYDHRNYENYCTYDDVGCEQLFCIWRSRATNFKAKKISDKRGSMNQWT